MWRQASLSGLAAIAAACAVSVPSVPPPAESGTEATVQSTAPAPLPGQSLPPSHPSVPTRSPSSLPAASSIAPGASASAASAIADLLGTRDEQLVIVGLETMSAGSPLFQRLVVTAEVDDARPEIDVRLFELFITIRNGQWVVVSVEPT